MVFGWSVDIYIVHVCNVFKVIRIEFQLKLIFFFYTIFVLFLIDSRHILGGFCAVVYFFSIHKDATRLQINPTSRDNFAFPFLFGQMYFLSAWIESHNRHYANETDADESEADRKVESFNIVQVSHTGVDQNSMHLRTNHSRMFSKNKIVIFNILFSLYFQPNFSKLALLTLFALVSWDFSTYIFVAQTIIIFIIAEMNFIKRKYLLLFNYIFAHLLADIIFSILKYGTLNFYNRNLSFHWRLLITFIVYVSRKRNSLRSIERIIINIFFYFMIIFMSLEIFNDRYHYTDLLLTKLHFKVPTFSTLLHLCKSENGFVDWDTLNVYNCLFISKFAVVFLITWSANWIHKRRQTKVVNENEGDRVQRAKNYLLEDYLEENKLSMIELANIERNKKIQKCMALLENVNYDYDEYKNVQRKMMEATFNKNDGTSERANFLNEVKKFKTEISEKDKIPEQSTSSDPLDDNITEELNTVTKELNEINEFIKNTENPNVPTDDAQKSQRMMPNWRRILVIEKPHYFFNILMMIVLIVMTILIVQFKYILTPVLCLMASTFPLKNWVPKNCGLWTIYIIIMASCVADQGIHNIKEQYSNKSLNNTQTKELDENIYNMISWISTNTDSNAIFAGKITLFKTFFHFYKINGS